MRDAMQLFGLDLGFAVRVAGFGTREIEVRNSWFGVRSQDSGSGVRISAGTASWLARLAGADTSWQLASGQAADWPAGSWAG